jgi:Domain of unknown function (DUF4265)
VRDTCAMWERTRLARIGHAPHDLATIRLLADLNQTGEPVHEELPARPLRTGAWQLLSTPGLVLGVAADDVVQIGDDGRFEVLERGGNVAVQLYTEQPQPELEKLLDEVEEKGGWLDGYDAGRLAVLTFPVSTGFEAIEGIVGGYARRHGEEWYYGNVYDDQDQPLNWWVESAPNDP